jgi:hypothetical protein
MKVYRVFAQVTVGAWAEIVASSLEDAQDKAADLELSDYNLAGTATEILPLEIEYEGEHYAD